MNKIVVIYGSYCSGKLGFFADSVQTGDQFVDLTEFDRNAILLAPDKDGEALDLNSACAETSIELIGNYVKASGDFTVWVIAEHKETLARIMELHPLAQVAVMPASEADCLRELNGRDNDAEDNQLASACISRWHEHHTPEIRPVVLN